MLTRWACALVMLVAGSSVPAAQAVGVRIKDITDIEGARPNHLIGVGLVVGLENTGARSISTQQVAVDMLNRFNITSRIVSQGQGDSVFRSSNISVVMVTSELGPFSRRGTKIDILVSVLDDATSLQGGTLLLTPLRGADGIDYAVAQGPVSLGGFLFTAPFGANQPLASVQKNHPTVGRISGGAIVEREARGEIVCKGQMKLLLREQDYVTAQSISRAINAKFPRAAHPLDEGAVNITIPPELSTSLVNFVGEVGLLEVTPDTVAKVVINERTGTIVAGHQVKIATVAVAHGNLSITTAEDFTASQPLPFGRGRTAILPQADLNVTEQGGTVRVVEQAVTVADLARALNALGATPRDLITIFQAIKKAGALHADLVGM